VASFFCRIRGKVAGKQGHPEEEDGGIRIVPVWKWALEEDAARRKAG